MRTAIVRTLLILAVSYCSVEIAALAAYWVIERQWFSFEVVSAARLTAKVGTLSNPASGTGAEVLHPFLGYVVNPLPNSEVSRRYQEEVHAYSGLGVNEFGLLDDGPAARRREPNQIVVGIFGGSVAHFFSAWGIERLLDGLRSIPGLRGKDMVFVRVAIGGYKQPQQLLALSYLLSLGGQFDIVINLDGFNEVVLPPAENIPQQVFPFYPRNWRGRVEGLTAPAAQPLVARLGSLLESRRDWAMWMDVAPIKMSVFGNVLWKARDMRIVRQITERQIELQGLQASFADYQVRGPRRQYPSEDALYRDLADLWRRSSEQMARLSEANGIRYFHFLQPNQYVPDSKPLSDTERRTAYAPDHPYANFVRRGYPFLREAGPRLTAAGVAFTDLTTMFSANRETLYTDICCHLNKDGNARLGTVIGRVIADAWSR